MHLTKIDFSDIKVGDVLIFKYFNTIDTDHTLMVVEVTHINWWPTKIADVPHRSFLGILGCSYDGRTETRSFFEFLVEDLHKLTLEN